MSDTRTPSTYELVYQEPPARTRAGGGQLFAVLEKLVADDNGQWAKVASCASRSGANSILTSIKQEKRQIPATADQFEFTTRTDSESNTSELYARFVGEAGAAAAAEAAATNPPAKRRGRPPKNPRP